MFFLVFNQVLVIKMMNVSGRAGLNISFPEHTSAYLFMKLGRIIEQVSAECTCKNDNSAYLHYLIMSPDPYFYSISGL